MKAAQPEYLTIKAACALLGVSPNTLRSWGASGKVREYRHPINNYRLFERGDLESLKERLEHPEPRVPGHRRGK